MKLALRIGLIAIAMLEPLGMQAWAARPAPAHRTSDKGYVRLADWAKAYDLDVRWIKRDEKLQLTNRETKLLLSIDSRVARINGVEVALLFPVVTRNGAVSISRLDGETTFRPILVPPKNRPGASVKTICIDPGHGGREPGFCVGSNQEKKYTLLLAEEVRQQLTRAGFKVTMTRSTDSFVSLPERPDMAKRRGADLFLSLHFNAVPSLKSTVHGSEVYCVTPAGASSSNAQGEHGSERWCVGNRFNDKNIFLAYQVQKALTKNLAVEDRGVRRARFWVLREAAMPAVLIEAGYMSHPTEGRKIFDTTYRREMAKAIVEGLLAYKHNVESGRS